VRLGLPLLAEIPLETPLRAACDEGRPGVLANPDSASSRAFTRLAATVA
jgi:MinD-like ATPase involved in chromosome partitioning or flagellar assembly